MVRVAIHLPIFVLITGCTAPAPTLEQREDTTHRDAAPPPDDPEELQFVVQGSLAIVRAYPRSDAVKCLLGQVRDALLSQTEQILRDVNEINKNAGKSPVKVETATSAILDQSLEISRSSRGAFDVTFAAMSQLWSFDGTNRAPSPQDIEKQRRFIGYQWLEMTGKGDERYARLKREGMKIGLGGLVKGHLVSQAEHLLDRPPITAFFIQIGGAYYVHGKLPDERKWRIGIRDPRSRDPSDYFAFIDVDEAAVTTSGDYERYFFDAQTGQRYHQVINPHTGMPAKESRSVTIVVDGVGAADDVTRADALDDAVFIMGPHDGLKILEQLDKAGGAHPEHAFGAVIVDKNNEVQISDRVRKMFHLVHEPTDGT